MYPPVDPDELTRHATEVGRVLLEAGLAPAGEPRRWPPLAFFDFTRIRARIKRCCYQHVRLVGLLMQDAVSEGLLFDHLLHTAWLLAYGYVNRDPDGMGWVDPQQPYDYRLSYELVEDTLAEFIGLGGLEELVELLRDDS